MSKNNHSLVKHLSFLCFYLFFENFIHYILFIFSSLPPQDPFRSTPSLLSQIQGFSPFLKKKMLPSKKEHTYIKKEKHMESVYVGQS